MRGRPLALRLAVLLAGIVIVVLVAAGWAVNRAASRSLDETIGPRDAQRLELAATVVDDALQRGIGPSGLRAVLRRIAGQSGGLVRVVDASGDVVAEAGRSPIGPGSATLSSDLSDAAGGGALEIVVPSAQAPFVRTFNAALVVTGVVAVAALLVAAVALASRVTGPLRQVAVAARRLGDGDLTARAEGGPDAESAELASAFNAMASRLERSEELRRRAASDLAHDLATPATVLESQLQAMIDGVVPADAAELERARGAAAGLSAVILQLGELTMAEAAPLHRATRRVGMTETSREIVASLAGLLRERSVSATVRGSDAAVFADPGQLARALRNVVTNAIQHSPTGGEVVIDVAEGTIRVSDNGPGISDQDLPYVFERFYRADRSRSGSPNGSGIGLTVARELIRANGGSLEVESTGPDGTVFRIELPPAR
jgi:two-component system sensor histidine kinase BaeS